jgi:uncharacterized protein YqeY
MHNPGGDPTRSSESGVEKLQKDLAAIFSREKKQIEEEINKYRAEQGGLVELGKEEGAEVFQKIFGLCESSGLEEEEVDKVLQQVAQESGLSGFSWEVMHEEDADPSDPRRGRAGAFGSKLVVSL